MAVGMARGYQGNDVKTNHYHQRPWLACPRIPLLISRILPYWNVLRHHFCRGMDKKDENKQIYSGGSGTTFPCPPSAHKANILVTTAIIVGEDKEMADVPSRAFNDGKFAEVQKRLTNYFNIHFPLPQNGSWTKFKVPESISSLVIFCLH